MKTPFESKRLEKNKAEIQDAYGDRDKKNSPVRRNGLVTEFHLAFYFVASFVNHDLCPCYVLYHHTGQPEKRLGIKKQYHGDHGGDHQGHHAEGRGLLHGIFKHGLFRPAEEGPVNNRHKVSRIQQGTEEQDK
jgi:hypothetical protein